MRTHVITTVRVNAVFVMKLFFTPIKRPRRTACGARTEGKHRKYDTECKF